MLRRYRAVLLVLALSVLLPSVGKAGESGSITFVNGTPYNWETSEQSSHHMDRWHFPDVITAGSTATVQVEWSDSHDRSSQSGMVAFSLEGTDLSFQLRAAAPGGVFSLSVVLTDFPTLGNPQGSSINLGWNPSGFVNFILAGEAGSFTSSKPPNAWMHESLGVLGSRSLRNLCIPGSHDAGMSKFKTGTSLARPCNTVTQTKEVLQQLHAGARYFDVRPVIHRNQFYTGHYSCDVQQGCQGAVGQSLDSIIDDVNSYTAAHQELVVLSLSNDLNTTGIYRPFTEGEWCDLLFKLTRLKNRFVAPNLTAVDLTQLTLGQFIGDGAAVVVVGRPSDSNITLDTLGCGFVPAGEGFYTPQSFPIFDSYSNTNDLKVMQQDQLAKLQAQRPGPDAESFLLSWTLTLQGQENLTCSNTILGLAAKAHPALYQNVLPVSNRRTYPNVLYADRVESRDIAALAMAVNSKASWDKPEGYVIYRELDNGISVAHSPNNDLKIGTDWRRTPMSSAIKTSETPAAVSFAGGLYVFYKGENDSRIYAAQPSGGNVLNGGSWNAQPLNPAIKTSTAPAVAVLGNTLYLFYKGEGDDTNIYLARSSGNVSDGDSWSSTPLNSAIKTDAAPAAAAFNGNLYLFYKEADGSVHLASSTTGNVFDGTTWSQTPLKDFATSAAPAAVVYEGVLYLFYKGKDDFNVFIARSEGDLLKGTTWTSSRLNPGINTTSIPRPVVIGDSLYMFYKGLETFIWIGWSQDGNLINGNGWTSRNLNTVINTGVGPGAAAM